MRPAATRTPGIEAEPDALGRVVTEVLGDDVLLREDWDDGVGFLPAADTGEAPSDEDEPL